MSEEVKTRVRRSNAEVKAEKKAKYLAEIEKHKEATKLLEQKIKELDKPTKTDAQIRKELLKLAEKKPLQELAAFVGKDLEELRNS